MPHLLGRLVIYISKTSSLPVCFCCSDTRILVRIGLRRLHKTHLYSVSSSLQSLSAWFDFPRPLFTNLSPIPRQVEPRSTINYTFADAPFFTKRVLAIKSIEFPPFAGHHTMSAQDYYHQGPPQQGGYPQQGYGQQGPPQYPPQVSDISTSMTFISSSSLCRSANKAILVSSPTALPNKADTTNNPHRCNTNSSLLLRAQEAVAVA